MPAFWELYKERFSDSLPRGWNLIRLCSLTEAILISDEEEAQAARLKYVQLATGAGVRDVLT